MDTSLQHFLRLLCIAVASGGVTEVDAATQIDVIGPFEISIEGLVQTDAEWYDNDRADLSGNGSDSEFELRRAELILKGKGDRFDWVVGYDAKADKFLDANLRWKRAGDALLLGQFKQPNSLEELSSSKHNDFIAKSMATNLFAIGRRLGLGYVIDHRQWGASASLFGRELTANRANGSGLGGRLYWTPLRDDDRLLHLGLSAVDHDTDADSVRLRSRPVADLAAARLIDTGALRNTDRQRTFGVEALWAQGPLKLQGEYLHSRVDRYGVQSADFSADGAYLQGLWNLTGESWEYRSGLPSVGHAEDPAFGMWQLGLRFDHANLNDGPVRGGREENLTVGVNWYWRSNFKVAANYVQARSRRFDPALGSDVDDDPRIIELRLQLVW